MNLKQVAALAGVSVSTVSRVLNGKTYVNEDTRKIVMEAIRKTNYQPNALAQSLKMGRSNTICLMIPSIENLMFPKLTRGVEDEARKNGMTVILCNTDEDAAIEKSYLETMKQRWIDGFIVCSLSSDAPHIRALRDEGYPLVLVNRFEESDIGQVDTVTADNFQIGYDATRYLIRTGHERVAIVCGREELLLYRERLRGYRKALEDCGLPVREELILHEASGNDGFYYQIRDLVAQGGRPDAIFCNNAIGAYPICSILEKHKVHPYPIVVGYDDDQALEGMLHKGICTAMMYQNPKKQASTALDYMFHCLYDGQPIPTIEKCLIVPSIVMEKNIGICRL